MALGSNIRHPRFGSPRRVVTQALAALADTGVEVEARSAIVDTPPLGPSARRYANAAAVVRAPLGPLEMLDRLQEIEAHFGRRRQGRRWRARVLDLDIVMWSGGVWSSPRLTIPHPEFRRRAFVLGPAAAIAGDWRDPVTALTLRHLQARLTRRRPLA